MKLRELRREYLRRCGNDYLLCQFCRFAENSTPDGACLHPLADRAVGIGHGCGMEPYDDCWGFRPAKGLGLDVIDAVIAEWQAAEREEQR